MSSFRNNFHIQVLYLNGRVLGRFELGLSSSLQLRQNAGADRWKLFVYCTPVAGQQVLRQRGAWIIHINVYHNDVSQIPVYGIILNVVKLLNRDGGQCGYFYT